MALSDYMVGGSVNRRQPTVTAGRSAASVTEGEPVIEVRIQTLGGKNSVTQVTVLDLLTARDLTQRLVAALTEAAIEIEGELRG